MTAIAPVKLNRKQRKIQRAVETAVIESSTGPASLVAAAVNVRVTAGYQNIRWGGTDWQQEGWLHYDTCPEFHAGINIGANNLSRARLIGVEVDPQTGELGTQPTQDGDVAEIMGQLFNGATGQSQALAMLYRHLEVAGDCWILATDNPDVDGATWEVLATTEVTSAGGGRIMVQQINGIPRTIDTTRELLIRVWQQHPKNRWEADSVTRALLPVLRELAALTAMVSATVKSRLASAGILWIPEEITLPTAKADKPNDTTQVKSLSQGAAGWLDLITEAMTAPIRDPDSAAAVVPMISVVKGDWISKIQHMEFGRDLDAMIEPLRKACVERLAVGMNLPPAILLGLESANHWTAWTITEDFARAYLAPKLELIADALTTWYLRRVLRVLGLFPEAFAINFDLDKLLPNQITVENAVHAYTAGVLKETSYMAALGFSAKDIADNEERARRLLTELLARGNPQTLAEVAESVARLYPGVIINPIVTPNGPLGSAGKIAPEPVAGAPAGQGPPALTAGPSSSPDQGANGA